MNADALGQTLRETLARIIEAPSDLPEPLAEIEGLRSATLRVLEGDEPAEERGEAFAVLFRAAERAELREWARAAMFRVLDEYFDLEPPPAPHPLELECRRLRRLGYSGCPVCRRDLPDEAELRRLDRLRRDWAESEARRRRATS